MAKSINYKRRRFIFLFLPIIIIVAILFIYKDKKIDLLDTVNPERTVYQNKIDTNGYMIFNEKVYTSSGQGVVEYFAKEAERVPRDFEVADLSLNEDSTGLKDELLKIQSAIEYKNRNFQDGDYLKVTETEENLIELIQLSLSKNDIKNTLSAVDTLELNTKKNLDISEITNLINLSNQELEDRKTQISREISNINEIYKAEEGGVVTYKIDGLEELLNYNKTSDLEFKDLDGITPKPQGQKSSVEKGDPVYKLIDNFSYKIAIPIDDFDFINSFKPGERVSLTLKPSTSIKGTVTDINLDKENGVMIVSLNDGLSKTGYDRIVPISVLKDETKCFSFPTEALIEVDGQQGVYTKEINGVIKFRPVKVLFQDDKNTYVSLGDSNGKIKIKDGSEDFTISEFNEVVLEPSLINEKDVYVNSDGN